MAASMGPPWFAYDLLKEHLAGVVAQRDSAVELLRRLVSWDDAATGPEQLTSDGRAVVDDARTFLASLDAAPSEEG